MEYKNFAHLLRILPSLYDEESKPKKTFQQIDDLEFYKEVAHKHPYMYQYFPANFQENDELILIALRETVDIRYLVPKTKLSKDFIFNMLKQGVSGWILDLLEPHVLSRQFIDNCMEVNSSTFFVASEYYQDEKICHKAVCGDARLFDYIPDNLRKNENIILAGLRQNWDFMIRQKEIEDLVKTSESFMFKVLAINKDAYGLLPFSWKEKRKKILETNGLCLEFMEKKYQKDDELVSTAVSQNPRSIQFADTRFTSTKHFLHLLKIDGMLLKYFSKEIQNDENCIKDATCQNMESVQYASDRLKSDCEFMKRFITQNGLLFKYCGKELKNKIDFSIFTFDTILKKSPHLKLEFIKMIPTDLIHNAEFLKNALRLDRLFLNHVPDLEMVGDCDVFLTAFKLDLDNLKFYFQRENQFNFSEIERIFQAHLKSLSLPVIKLSCYHYLTLKNNNKDLWLNFLKQMKDEIDSHKIAKKTKEMVETLYVDEISGRVDSITFDVMSNELKYDKSVVLKVVELKGSFLKSTSKRLKDDHDVVLEAIKNDPMSLKYASHRLRKNKNIITTALTIDGNSFEYIAESCKIIDTNALVAVVNTPSALRLVPEKFKNDPEFILNCMKQSNEIFDFELLPEVHRDNTEIVKLQLTKNPHSLKYASKRLRNDPDIVFHAIEEDHNCLEYASDDLKNDLNFMTKCIESDSGCLRFASEDIQENATSSRIACYEIGKKIHKKVESNESIDFGLSVAYREPSFFGFPQESGILFIGDTLNKYNTDEIIKRNRELIKKKNSQGIEYTISKASSKSKNDKEFILEAAKYNGTMIQHASEDLKNDKEVVFEAVKNNSSAFDHASKSLKQDKEFILSLAKFQYIKLNRDIITEDIVFRLISCNPLYVQDLDHSLDNLLKSIQSNHLSYAWIPESFRKLKDLAKESIRNVKINNGSTFVNFPDELKNDGDFVKECLKINPKIFDFIDFDHKFKNETDLIMVARGYYKNYVEIFFHSKNLNDVFFQFDDVVEDNYFTKLE